MSPVLVINAGSSTIKYQLLDVGDEGDDVLAAGLLDRIGGEGSKLVHRVRDGQGVAGQDPLIVEEPVADHEAEFHEVLAAFERTAVPR